MCRKLDVPKYGIVKNGALNKKSWVNYGHDAAPKFMNALTMMRRIPAQIFQWEG